MKLINELKKNFRLIFRNWSSLALIILAPLFLILLVGYSFSGDQLHDIRIGVDTEDYSLVQPLEQNISSFADIIRYSDIKNCISDMQTQRIHLCIEISGQFQEDVPSGSVKFYYDNTRKKISVQLLSEMKDYFGLTSEKISLITTQAIFSNIQDLLAFLNERIKDIDDVKEEAISIREDMEQRKENLTQIRDDFRPKYLIIKSAQSSIHYYTDSFENTSEALLVSLGQVQNTTNALDNQLNNTNLTNISTSALRFNLRLLNSQIEDLRNTTRLSLAETKRITDSIDSVVTQLDTINTFLDEEINRTENYIRLINQSIIRIEFISEESGQRMEELSRLDPSFAEKVVRPITQSFKALKQEIEDIQIAFPLIISTIIIFISLLFSNIISLLEINNKAYVRNILAPVDDFNYTAGMILTNFIIIFFQAGVLLTVAQASFGIPIISNLEHIVPVIVTLILAFVFFGMTIAYLSKNMQTSILLSTFTALAFFLFSDAINALEAMPKIAADIAVFNPIVIVNIMFRRILFFRESLADMPVHFGILIAYMLIAFTVLFYISKKKNKQRI